MFDVYTFTRKEMEWEERECQNKKRYSFLTYICHLVCRPNVVLKLTISQHEHGKCLFNQKWIEKLNVCVRLIQSREYDTAFLFHHLRKMRRIKTKPKAGFQLLKYLRCCISLNIDSSLRHFLTFRSRAGSQKIPSVEFFALDQKRMRWEPPNATLFYWIRANDRTKVEYGSEQNAVACRLNRHYDFYSFRFSLFVHSTWSVKF